MFNGLVSIKKAASFALRGLVFSVCVAAVSASCARMEWAAARPAADFRTFREVPGVNRRDIGGVERVIEKRPALIYGAYLSNESFFREAGQPAGFSTEFCAWMSDFFGVKITLVIFDDWKALMDSLASGDVDFTGEFTATAARQKMFHMSGPIVRRPVMLVSREGSEPLEIIAARRPVRYGFIDGTVTMDQAANYLTAPYQAVFCADAADACAQLLAGRFDAFVDETITAMPENAGGEPLCIRRLFPPAYCPVSLSTAQDDLAPFITVMDKYLEAGGGETIRALYRRGNDAFTRYAFMRSLKPEAQRYLARRLGGDEAIPVILDEEDYPLSFRNRLTGDIEGIVPDVLQEISALTGLRFEQVNVHKEKRAEFARLLESGKAALLSRVVPPVEPPRRAVRPDFPFTLDRYGIISLDHFHTIDSDDVYGYRVGIVNNTPSSAKFHEWFPGHRAVTGYDGIIKALDALDRGEIDLVMSNENSMLRAEGMYERSGYKMNLIFPQEFPIYFALNHNEVMLNEVLGRALREIGTAEISDRWRTRIFDYRGKVNREQRNVLLIFTLVLVVLLVLLTVLFVRNRSMERRLQAQVKKRTEELEVVLKARGRFFARISHEIRTPLSAIVGMAAIAKKWAAEPKAIHSIDEIITSSGHLLNLLNDLKDISGIESGRMKVNKEAFSLDETAAEIKTLMSQRFEEKKLDFQMDYEEIPHLAIMGDSLRLRQIILNLLENALKFTPEGGKVTFTMERTAETDSLLTVRFRVRDTGIGMTSQQIARIFGKDRQDSPGMGLELCKSLVEAMGGEIQVESVVYKGTVFTFTLNFEKTVIVRAAEPDGAAEESPDFAEKRILLVEDLDINREILIEQLKDTGVVIDEAADGREAVRLFTESPSRYYDLIFMDIEMPVMNGYDATKQIRALDRADAKSVPIVAMTASALQEDVERAMLAGMNEHLAKPVELDTVLQVLKRELGRG